MVDGMVRGGLRWLMDGKRWSSMLNNNIAIRDAMRDSMRSV